MKKFLSLAIAGVLAVATTANADLINEFEPNPVGTDPATQDIELIGTPNAAFSGWLTTIDTDSGSALGVVNETYQVSGSYDANGYAVVTVNDLENPSFTLVFSSASPGAAGTALDTNADMLLDDISGFGTVFDAISTPDTGGDAGFYAGQLGGQDFAYTGDEPKLIFRDGTTGAWYAVNDQGNVPENVFDINAVQVPNASFDMDPEVTTFGSQNPSLIPEPATLALLCFGGIALIRRRR